MILDAVHVFTASLIRLLDVLLDFFQDQIRHASEFTQCKRATLPE